MHESTDRTSLLYIIAIANNAELFMLMLGRWIDLQESLPCGLVGSKLFGRRGWDPGIPPGGYKDTRHGDGLKLALGN